MSFKDSFIEFQRIVWELKRIRDHNMSFGEDSSELFLMAEGLLVVLAIERFLRMILGEAARDSQTLFNLLEMATSASRSLIVLPGRLSRDDAVRRVNEVRNALMHGNYEQRAREYRLPSKDAYFRSSHYISEVEALFRILNRILKQIDPATGQPFDRDVPWMREFLASPDFLDLGYASKDEEERPKRLVPSEPTKVV